MRVLAPIGACRAGDVESDTCTPCPALLQLCVLDHSVLEGETMMRSVSDIVTREEECMDSGRHRGTSTMYRTSVVMAAATWTHHLAAVRARTSESSSSSASGQLGSAAAAAPNPGRRGEASRAGRAGGP